MAQSPDKKEGGLLRKLEIWNYFFDAVTIFGTALLGMPEAHKAAVMFSLYGMAVWANLKLGKQTFQEMWRREVGKGTKVSAAAAA